MLLSFYPERVGFFFFFFFFFCLWASSCYFVKYDKDVSINKLLMLNKYAAPENKRNDLGLFLVIFTQSVSKTFKNKLIKGIF
jgi:hypothetical protein